MAREIINELRINDGQVDPTQLVLSYGWKALNGDVPIAILEATFLEEDGTVKGKTFPLYWGDLQRLSGAVKRAIKLERDTN